MILVDQVQFCMCLVRRLVFLEPDSFSWSYAIFIFCYPFICFIIFCLAFYFMEFLISYALFESPKLGGGKREMEGILNSLV